MNKETFLNFRPKDTFVDFKKSFEDIKESSQEMLNKVAEYNPVKVSNVQGTIDDEKNYIESNLNKARDKVNFMTDLDKISGVLKQKPKAVKRKKELKLFDFSWRLYRTISLLLILVSFFVLKAIYDKFVIGGANPYILKIYNVVAVLFIINLCVFMFYVTYYRYISTLKGQKGRKGGRGVKGVPGNNKMCDISKKKIATLYREKNRKPRKDIIDTSSNVVIDLNDTKIYETGWWNITKPGSKPGSKYELVKPENGNIGVFCKEPNCETKDFTNVGENLKTYMDFFGSSNDTNDKKKKLKENKPIIGASVNFNKINKNIQAIMFYSDKNKGHNPEKYKYGIFGEQKTKYRSIDISLNKKNLNENEYFYFRDNDNYIHFYLKISDNDKDKIINYEAFERRHEFLVNNNNEVTFILEHNDSRKKQTFTPINLKKYKKITDNILEFEPLYNEKHSNHDISYDMLTKINYPPPQHHEAPDSIEITQSKNIDYKKYLGKDSLRDISKNSAKQDFRCPPNSAIYKIEGVHDNNGLKGLKFYCQDIYTGKTRKAYNPDNKKVYGVSFGVEPFPESDEYYYDKIECPFTKTTIKNSNNKEIDTMKPSFVSHIGGTFDKNKNKIYNLNVGSCSYYKK